MKLAIFASIGLLFAPGSGAAAAPVIGSGQCQHQWNVYASKRSPKSFASTTDGGTCGWQSRGPVEQIDAKALAECGKPHFEALRGRRSSVGEEAAYVDGCIVLKPGVRVDVTRELAELSPKVRIVGMRVYGNGASVDGFTLSSNLGDAMSGEQ